MKSDLKYTIFLKFQNILNRLSNNQLDSRWIHTSFFDLLVNRHFEIRYSISKCLKIRTSVPNFFYWIRRPWIKTKWNTTDATMSHPSGFLLCIVTTGATSWYTMGDEDPYHTYGLFETCEITVSFKSYNYRFLAFPFRFPPVHRDYWRHLVVHYGRRTLPYLWPFRNVFGFG